MSGNSSDPSGKEAWVTGLLQGVKKRFPKELRTLMLLGKEVPVEDVEALLEHLAGTFGKVRRQKTLLHAAIAKRDEAFKATEAILEAIEAYARAIHGHAIDELDDYGLSPRKKTQLSSEELVISTMKRLETRKAHGIRGRRQRERITVTPQPTVTVRDGEGKLLGGQGAEEPGMGPQHLLSSGNADTPTPKR